jgi:hypothetical protein
MVYHRHSPRKACTCCSRCLSAQPWTTSHLSPLPHPNMAAAAATALAGNQANKQRTARQSRVSAGTWARCSRAVLAQRPRRHSHYHVSRSRSHSKHTQLQAESCAAESTQHSSRPGTNAKQALTPGAAANLPPRYCCWSYTRHNQGPQAQTNHTQQPSACSSRACYNG